MTDGQSDASDTLFSTAHAPSVFECQKSSGGGSIAEGARIEAPKAPRGKGRVGRLERGYARQNIVAYARKLATYPPYPPYTYHRIISIIS